MLKREQFTNLLEDTEKQIILMNKKTTPKSYHECVRTPCLDCSEVNNTKYQFISCPLRKELKRYEVIK